MLCRFAHRHAVIPLRLLRAAGRELRSYRAQHIGRRVRTHVRKLVVRLRAAHQLWIDPCVMSRRRRGLQLRRQRSSGCVDGSCVIDSVLTTSLLKCIRQRTTAFRRAGLCRAGASQGALIALIRRGSRATTVLRLLWVTVGIPGIWHTWRSLRWPASTNAGSSGRELELDDGRGCLAAYRSCCGSCSV